MGSLFLLLADAAPPADLALWIGGVVLAGLGSALGASVRGVFSKSTAAEAESRAELKSDVKSILSTVNELRTSHAVQAGELSTLMGRFTAVEVRQDKQAEAHREALGTLAARITRLESAKRGAK